MQAISELYNRPIEVYEYNKEPIILNGTDNSDNFPIRLSYHNGNHYNSLRDLNTPSIGVGLGLPDLEPGLADKSQVEEAKKESSAEDVERVLVEKAKEESEQHIIDEILLNQHILEESEMDYEQQQIEQAILMQSLEEYYKENAI